MIAFTGFAPASWAQLSSYVQESFTGGTTNNSWYFFQGGCLTAGSTTTNSSPGQIPSCVSLTTAGAYYNSPVIPNNNPFEPLVGGDIGTFPDTAANGGGALRFQNVQTLCCWPNGYNERGGILSNFSFPLAASGLNVTFTTETYEGVDGNGTGADGIGFFLQDASKPASLGSTGGSLGYTCSNRNPQADGMQGGYLLLGVDEYGNSLNGALITNSNGTITPQQAATYGGPGNNPDGWDNTATGYGWAANRIGMRGAGSTSWAYLSSTWPQYYPSTLTATQQYIAVQQTCMTGYLWNYSAVTPATPQNGNTNPQSGATTPNPLYPTQKIPNPFGSLPLSTILLPYNYAPIPNAYKVLSGVKISNLAAKYRGNGTQTATQMATGNYGYPITYQLSITPNGLLSLSYSYNGGAYVSVITNQSITSGNGPLPSAVRFGFSASTGGGTNIHELMCFQATPQTTASSSVGLNQKQVAKVQTGTQVYFAYYDPKTWAGSLVSKYLIVDPNNANNIIIDSAANWDASCELTGVASGATCVNTGVAGPTAPQSLSSRQMLTWSGSAGIPFEWANLTSAEQTALDTGDSSLTPTPPAAGRLNYLRGDRSNELTSTGTLYYRDRASVLGDIVDSSPAWVGPPSVSFPTVWHDNYATTAPTPPENTGQTYAAYTTQEQTRINMVYTGANDGFLHGFESGYFNSAGAYVGTGSGTSFVGTLNDGKELLAYMPGYILNNINTSNVEADYSNPQYGHKFDVDAEPGTGDVYYSGGWHTLLVGGLGPGGAAIYALDVTNPANTTDATIPDPTFSESNAATLVIGEWNATTLSCSGNSTCGTNLGNTYGSPQIRRFHNGQWGAVFGNGFNSTSGDAGIFVMLLNATGTAPTFYYISSHTSSCAASGPTQPGPNGIAYTSPTDLDGDHIIDYVYAGDLCGNVWRFDLTSPTPSTWASTNPALVFNTGTGQPITTQIMVDLSSGTPYRRILLEFGTGRQIPMTTTSAPIYAEATQFLYGIWDWNMATWNANSTTKFMSLTTGPSSLSGTSNLTGQTATIVNVSGVDYRTVTNNAVPWEGISGGTSYGWYLSLISGNPNPADINQPTASATPQIYEQIIYSPALVDNALILNTTIPPSTSLSTCTSTLPGGYTLAINPATGGAFTNSVFGNANHNYITLNGQVVFGEAESGTGTPSVVTYNGLSYVVSQNVQGTGFIAPVNLQSSTLGSRLTWIEKR